MLKKITIKGSRSVKQEENVNECSSNDEKEEIDLSFLSKLRK